MEISFDFELEFRNVPWDRIPYFFKIYAEIVVYEHISHGNDLVPGDIRLTLANIGRQFGRGFPNDLNVVEHPGLD